MQEMISSKATRAAWTVPTIAACTIFAMSLFVLLPVSDAFADSDVRIDQPMTTEAGRIARGGRLYDKWFAVINAEKPEDTHAAWPASNTKKKGNATWRCKSCHGWDNMGKDGAYASGSYQTGIGGVKSHKDGDATAIIAAMKDDNHALADKMSDQDFADLALFVSKGQVDMDSYIDRASKAPKGDAASGQAVYETLCANCHGVEGTRIKDMKPLGKLMSNPWEILHKILYGQPNEEMPALYALDHQIAVDIMAHLATLPTER